MIRLVWFCKTQKREVLQHLLQKFSTWSLQLAVQDFVSRLDWQYMKVYGMFLELSSNRVVLYFCFRIPLCMLLSPFHQCFWHLEQSSSILSGTKYVMVVIWRMDVVGKIYVLLWELCSSWSKCQVCTHKKSFQNFGVFVVKKIRVIVTKRNVVGMLFQKWRRFVLQFKLVYYFLSKF